VAITDQVKRLLATFRGAKTLKAAGLIAMTPRLQSLSDIG
jgi:hypothetical protein